MAKWTEACCLTRHSSLAGNAGQRCPLESLLQIVSTTPCSSLVGGSPASAAALTVSAAQCLSLAGPSDPGTSIESPVDKLVI